MSDIPMASEVCPKSVQDEYIQYLECLVALHNTKDRESTHVSPSKRGLDLPRAAILAHVLSKDISALRSSIQSQTSEVQTAISKCKETASHLSHQLQKLHCLIPSLLDTKVLNE